MVFLSVNKLSSVGSRIKVGHVSLVFTTKLVATVIWETFSNRIIARLIGYRIKGGFAEVLNWIPRVYGCIISIVVKSRILHLDDQHLAARVFVIRNNINVIGVFLKVATIRTNGDGAILIEWAKWQEIVEGARTLTNGVDLTRTSDKVFALFHSPSYFGFLAPNEISGGNCIFFKLGSSLAAAKPIANKFLNFNDLTIIRVIDLLGGAVL